MWYSPPPADGAWQAGYATWSSVAAALERLIHNPASRAGTGAADPAIPGSRRAFFPRCGTLGTRARALLARSPPVRAQRPALVLLANRVAHPDLAWHALVLSWDTSPSSQEPVVAHTDVPLSSFHAHALVHSGDSQAFLAQVKALLDPPAEDMRLMRTV